MTGYEFAIDLPVRTDWRNVDLVRTSVEHCFTAMFSDVDGCHVLAMVTGELLENAIKYGDWSGADRSFRLRVAGVAKSARVCVENPVRADDDSAREVIATLDWIRSFESAEDAYRARLLETAQNLRGGSKLGLARIAYEGNCTLEAELQERSLRITAEVHL